MNLLPLRYEFWKNTIPPFEPVYVQLMKVLSVIFAILSPLLYLTASAAALLELVKFLKVFPLITDLPVPTYTAGVSAQLLVAVPLSNMLFIKVTYL